MKSFVTSGNVAFGISRDQIRDFVASLCFMCNCRMLDKLIRTYLSQFPWSVSEVQTNFCDLNAACVEIRRKRRTLVTGETFKTWTFKINFSNAFKVRYILLSSESSDFDTQTPGENVCLNKRDY